MAKSERMTIEEAVEYILSQGWELISQDHDAEHFEAKCPKGHQLRMSCSKFRPGTQFSCPVCSTCKIPDESTLKEVIESQGCKYIQYNQGNVVYECNCGKRIGTTRWRDFVKGVRCGKCASEKIIAAKRMTEKEAEKLCQDLDCKFTGLTFRNISKNSEKKTAVIHFICGTCNKNEHFKNISNFRKSPKCPECGRKK